MTLQKITDLLSASLKIQGSLGSRVPLSLPPRYVKYGSGPARFPLPDMLKYVIEFASTKPASENSASQSDARMTLPLSSEHCPASDLISKER